MLSKNLVRLRTEKGFSKVELSLKNVRRLVKILNVSHNELLSIAVSEKVSLDLLVSTEITVKSVIDGQLRGFKSFQITTAVVGLSPLLTTLLGDTGTRDFLGNPTEYIKVGYYQDHGIAEKNLNPSI